MSRQIDTAAMTADAETMPQDREGIVAWHMERGSTRENAERVASLILDPEPENSDR